MRSFPGALPPALTVTKLIEFAMNPSIIKQEIIMRIQFWVADEDERETLAELGQRLVKERVDYKRGDSTFSWQILSGWSYDVVPTPPWKFTFDFEADAVRALELLDDPRLESVKFLEKRAQQTNTQH
ncbi:hypothetical protein C1890_10100 [Pseudomonas sp. DP16D-R1]|jgi:hypothetical protein|nr:hypothetical protein C1890_10100 [Pseudomonas sp. DP16D-R1]